MISLIFFALAAICNAVMDVVSFHYDESVFWKPWGNRKDNLWNQWWNANFSWKNKYILGDTHLGRKKLFWKINYPVQLTDAWHFFKMMMIIFIALSAVTFEKHYMPLFYAVSNPLFIILLMCGYGLAWNLTFNLFYNHLLIRKQKK